MSTSVDSHPVATPTSYLGPFITMVFLFFIVGFLTTANMQFQAPLQRAFLSGAGDMLNTLTLLITFSWFLAYPLCGGIGARWINAYGYKSTLLRGLMVMICGLALFYLSSAYTYYYPESAITISSITIPSGFFIFLLGSFVTGASATILQVVINPYLTACYVKGTQPLQRMAMGGSANSVGTTLAPYFVSGIVFGGVALQDVEVKSLMWPFFCLMVVIALVAVVLRALSLPDIQGTRASQGENLPRSVWSFRHLTLGVVAIFFYVGVEVCVGANINLYAIELGAADVALMATIYWGLMLVGRLICSSLSQIPPRAQLTFTTVGAALLVTLAMVLSNPWLLAFVGLFHSIMWGAIFTLAVDGLGRYTSAASGVFMIGVVGGAILPLLQGGLADWLGGWQWSWTIVLVGEGFMLYYALIGSRVRATDIDIVNC
ncbi:MAG: MFS transporter [Bacteroidales bacterium]|nr:MFS transporter [Bacteroidales bacterium]